jgi:hypothetical protein
LPKSNNAVKQRYSAGFRRVYSTGAVGGFDGYDFTLTFFRDNVKYPEEALDTHTFEREFVAEVILPAATLKEITRWLLQNLNEIEEKNGIIREPMLKVETKTDEAPKASSKALAAYS